MYTGCALLLDDLTIMHLRKKINDALVMMVGLEVERVRQGLAILATQPRGADRTDPHGIRQVADYSMPNVSDKVLRIIHSHTDYVNRVVWKKY